MPEKLDSCVKQVMEDGKSESQAFAICKAALQDGSYEDGSYKDKYKDFKDKKKISKRFQDAVTYDAEEKSAISVRDGVIEYYGAELDMEPFDKVFTVYRSPATISNAAMAMEGIPLTKEHVELDRQAPVTGAFVTDARMVDYADEDTNSHVAVKNKISLNDSCKSYLDGRRQLSLGYFGDLVPHQEYDFEQLNIIPHHLAAVPEGRCGAICSFLDKKVQLETLKNKEDNMALHKVFKDQEGEGESVDIEKVAEIAMALPEAIKSVPIEKLQEIIPALQEIMAMAGMGGEKEEKKEETEEDMAEDAQEDTEQLQEAIEATDEDMKEEEEEEKKTVYMDAAKKMAKSFADKAVKEYAEVVDKARNFLDESYDFKAKDAKQIMKDALATQTKEAFKDSELPLAFKLLRKNANYATFGDSQAKDPYDEIANKELK